MTPCIVACVNKHMTYYKVKNKAALLRRAKAGKIVCPRCGRGVDEYEQPTWSPIKHFFCDQGHVTSIYPFSEKLYNISWSDKEYVNADNGIDHVLKDIADGHITCPVTIENNTCDHKLKPLDDSELKPAKLLIAKTKTRVGDIWDKNNCPEPKLGSYDKDFNYRESEFSKRNKLRLRKIRKERLTKAVGDPITKPTDRNYKVRNYRRPPKSEI